MAVLEKRIGLNLANQDAYLNVAGGIRIDEPAVDLGIAAAIASSFKEIRINPLTVAIGEIGLAGEIRGVSYIESRVKEASKLGFNTCVIPEDNLKGLKNVEGINIVGVKTLRQGLEIILGG
jgi:DNA repair protein RadA/Sms